MSKNAVVVRRFLAVVTVVWMGVALSACGGGTTSPDTPDTTSTITTTLPTQSFSGIAPGEVVFAEVTINGTGVLTGTADWTFPTNDIDIYVTAPSCRAADIIDLQSDCQAIGRTTAVTTKPERLTVNVTQGNYRVWIANFGSSSETGTLQMTATVSR